MGSKTMNPVATIESLGKLFNDAAAAIGKLADSVSHVIKLGAQGYDAAVARRTHSQMVALRTQLEAMKGFSNRPTLDAIAQYVGRPNDSPDYAWKQIIYTTGKTATQVSELLDDVLRVRSDFVLDDAYRDILAVLHGRNALLKELQSMKRPSTEDEMKALWLVRAKYQKLMKATDKASDKLAAYLKNIE